MIFSWLLFCFGRFFSGTQLVYHSGCSVTLVRLGGIVDCFSMAVGVHDGEADEALRNASSLSSSSPINTPGLRTLRIL